MTRRIGYSAGAASLALMVAASGAAAGEPAFTSVQVEGFSVPGALSNAWADFDNDGDLPLSQ